MDTSPLMGGSRVGNWPQIGLDDDHLPQVTSTVDSGTAPVITVTPRPSNNFDL